MAPQTKRSSSTGISIKALSWRVLLTIIILSALAGPGAHYLQQLSR